MANQKLLKESSSGSAQCSYGNDKYADSCNGG